MIDWRYIKHLYLGTSLVYLSIVIIAQATSINSWIVLLTMIGHAVLAAKENTLAYFYDLLTTNWRGNPVELNPNYSDEEFQRNIA